MAFSMNCSSALGSRATMLTAAVRSFSLDLLNSSIDVKMGKLKPVVAQLAMPPGAISHLLPLAVLLTCSCQTQKCRASGLIDRDGKEGNHPLLALECGKQIIPVCLGGRFEGRLQR